MEFSVEPPGALCSDTGTAIVGQVPMPIQPEHRSILAVGIEASGRVELLVADAEGHRRQGKRPGPPPGGPPAPTCTPTLCRSTFWLPPP